MKNAMTVFRKEFYRVISDRRLIFTAIILPGLAIYLMYSFMGNALTGEVEDVSSHEIIVYHENMPSDYQTLLNSSDRDFSFHDGSSLTDAEVETMLDNNEMDIFIQFPLDFDTLLADYEETDYIVPVVDLKYNSGEKYSSNGYAVVMTHLNTYAGAITYERFGDGVNAFYPVSTDYIDEDVASGQMLAGILPMLIVMFLFSGAMSIGPDSIAGEKERGTIATLLVTPIKRSELAIGKVLSLTVISLFSAASSFLGILLSLPKLMGSDVGAGPNVNIYAFSDYAMIFIVLLATVLLVVGLVSVISAYAKNIKEASMLILPFYFLSVIIGITSMFSGEAAKDAIVYIIPIYSTINVLIGLLTFSATSVQLLLMIISNLVYVSVLIFLMTKLFESERVMFQK
jgi:sodium transport system permease protein